MVSHRLIWFRLDFCWVVAVSTAQGSNWKISLPPLIPLLLFHYIGTHLQILLICAGQVLRGVRLGRAPTRADEAKKAAERKRRSDMGTAGADEAAILTCTCSVWWMTGIMTDDAWEASRKINEWPFSKHAKPRSPVAATWSQLRQDTSKTVGWIWLWNSKPIFLKSLWHMRLQELKVTNGISFQPLDVGVVFNRIDSTMKPAPCRCGECWASAVPTRLPH